MSTQEPRQERVELLTALNTKTKILADIRCGWQAVSGLGYAGQGRYQTNLMAAELAAVESAVFASMRGN